MEKVRMMKKFAQFTLILVFILAASLSACSQAVAGFEGQEWKLTSVNGKAPLAGSKVTLKFENGKISGSSGCNSYGGEYSIQGGKLTVTNVVSTEMACMDPAGVMDQEAAFFKAINEAAGYQISGNRLEVKNAAS